MSMRTTFSDLGQSTYRNLRKDDGAPPTGYVLAVSGVLAVVTFALVYLATFSYASGF